MFYCQKMTKLPRAGSFSLLEARGSFLPVYVGEEKRPAF